MYQQEDRRGIVCTFYNCSRPNVKVFSTLEGVDWERKIRLKSSLPVYFSSGILEEGQSLYR